MSCDQIVDGQQVRLWAREQKTWEWMSQEYERCYNRLVPAHAFQEFLAAHPSVDPLTALVPWEVDPEDRWDLACAMLHIEARRRSGHRLRARDLKRLEVWKAQLAQRDLVVHYSDSGFTYVPRRAGVDTDLIRELRVD